jgi:lipopolysaccharide biosynthesis glycosyltransferase
MEKWKTNQCEKKLQDFAYEKNGKTPYVDQGLINGALQSYICTLPLKFNVITVFFDYSYREILRYRKPSGFFYSEEEVTNAVTAPCIIHYTKSIFTERPWILNSTHKKKDLWEKNKQISPWKDMEPSDCTIHGIKKLYVEISRRLPRNLSIMLQSFLHTVVKPYVDVH